MSDINRIAIATENNCVCGHFGHCPEFTIVDVNRTTKQIIKQEVIPNPGHQPGFLPKFLGEKGVQAVIAGGMGPSAQELFIAQKIPPLIGVSGTIEQVISDFLNDTLAIGHSSCDHDSKDHTNCGEH